MTTLNLSRFHFFMAGFMAAFIFPFAADGRPGMVLYCLVFLAFNLWVALRE